MKWSPVKENHWSGGVWLEASSLKCEPPERRPLSWDLKPGTELLAVEFVGYLAPPISTGSALTWTKDDKETSLLSRVKRFPPPLNGSLGGFSEGNDRWKCSAQCLTTSWHSANNPFFPLTPVLDTCWTKIGLLPELAKLYTSWTQCFML